MKTRHRFLKSPAALMTVLSVALLQLPTVAFAQDGNPESDSSAFGRGSDASGPEGSWLYTVTIPGYTFLGIETYAAGGGYTEADQLSFTPLAVASAGHGVWKATWDRTFVLTYVNLTFDSFNLGNPTGTLKVRQTAKLSRDGNSYSGSGDYTYYDQNGNAIPSISGTFTITATRMHAEEPGKK